MFRRLRGATDNPVAKARRVVCTHGAFVIGTEVVNEADALDGIAGFVELAEDVKQVVGNCLVADEFALAGLPVEVDMQDAQVAEIRPPQAGIWHRGKRTTTNAGEHRIRKGHRREPVVANLSMGRREWTCPQANAYNYKV